MLKPFGTGDEVALDLVRFKPAWAICCLPPMRSCSAWLAWPKITLRSR